jgi:hypothetical protein
MEIIRFPKFNYCAALHIFFITILARPVFARALGLLAASLPARTGTGGHRPLLPYTTHELYRSEEAFSIL